MGDETVGNPHRTRIAQVELFELSLLLKLDKQFPVEQFEVRVSQSTGPSPPLSTIDCADALDVMLLWVVWKLFTATPGQLVIIQYSCFELDTVNIDWWMYMYIYIYTHTRTYKNIYIYIYIYEYVS